MKKIYTPNFDLFNFFLRKCSTALKVPVYVDFWDVCTLAVQKRKTVCQPYILLLLMKKRCKPIEVCDGLVQNRTRSYHLFFRNNNLECFFFFFVTYIITDNMTNTKSPPNEITWKFVWLAKIF